MILVLEKMATHAQAEQLILRLNAMGLKAIKETQAERVVIAILNGVDSNTNIHAFVNLPLVERVENFSQQAKLAGKDVYKKRTKIQVGDTMIGGDELIVMAGPCSIENEAQIHRIAQSVANAGAQILRGGAFKPRTSPYDFQGLGEAGVHYLKAAARANGLVSISEVMEASQLDVLVGNVDILQIGARNMQNFNLLKIIGQTKVPVMLKRGLCATYREFLMAAEYILNEGNPYVILCERGIRTYENYTRNTLDIGAVPVLQELSHLPIIVDPSHGTGIRNMIAPMSRAAVAAGANGIMVEVHYDPDHSYSDAQQAISTEHFANMMPALRAIHHACASSEECLYSL